MTTKLNKKLNYAIESKNLITSALQRKGAQISNKTPLRQFPQAIDALKTTALNKDVLSAFSFNEGDKVMIQEHQHNLHSPHNSFTGSLVGNFLRHLCNFECFHNNMIYIGFYNKDFQVYRFDEETETISPVHTKTTNISQYNVFKNPIHSHLGSNYVLTPEKEDPFTPIAYPSGGNFSNFEPNYCCFDSNGDYLIQYKYINGLTDILKINHDEAQDLYSYELIHSFTLTPQQYISNFSKASGDIHTSHTFALAGKMIFKINPETNEITSFNIMDYNLPTVSNPDILLFGKNYLILSEGPTSVRTVYFMKATPIDETLSAQEEGFYDNPSNYTFSIIHTEKATHMPDESLCWHKNNIYSPQKAHLNYYIHVEKEKIDDISDFSFEFGRTDDTITQTIYLNENLAIAYAEKPLKTTQNTAIMSQMYHRDHPSMPFQAKEKAFTCSCVFLNEHGFGVFSRNGGHNTYKLEKNTPKMNISISPGMNYPITIYMKNGLSYGYYYNDTIAYNFGPYASSASISLSNGIKAIIDEDFISNTYSKSVYYIDDKGQSIKLNCSEMTKNQSSNFIFKYKGDYYFFNFQNQSGVNLSGTSQKVTFDLENKTFYLGETSLATGHFTKNTNEALLKVKNKDLWISKTCLFGVKKEEDGHLHFMEIQFPTSLLEAFDGQTPSYVQAYYDGSCGFLFNNGSILTAHLEWDESSSTAHLKANTSIQTIYPKIQLQNNFYSYLSPFKIYQSVYASSNSIALCSYTNPLQQEKHFFHLEENKQENWNSTSVTAYVSGPTQIDEDNYTLQNASLDF